MPQRRTRKKEGLPIYLQVTIGIILAGIIMTGISFAGSVGVIFAVSNFFEQAIKSNSTIKPTSISYETVVHSDTNPIEHPEYWNEIESKDKKCWFHKTTNKKICIAKG